jgi:ATP-dependent phosphofructokinase / diphosphate-dependent phosphofructokinase
MAQRVGILVGGGPAPGINGVIAAATLEARNNGLEVVGILDGYAHLARGDASAVRMLDADDVARVHLTGGSILRTSRTNPAKDDATLDRVLTALDALDLRYLLCIGGDDTTYGAARIAARAGARLGVASVPKTIDNDLPLPENAPTFGFETARSVGAQIVANLMEDARTTSRWYVAVTMGRKAGWLALGICKSAGATLAVIPEEFDAGPGLLERVVDTIVGAIVKRRATGRDHGVAVIAEGLAEKLAPSELAGLADLVRDAYDNVRLADVPLGYLVKNAIGRRLASLGLVETIVPKDVGYELRCAEPVAFDVDYTRTLGYGAIRYLLSGESGALVALAGGRVMPLSLDSLLDPGTGKIRVRLVDVTTESYRVARSTMIRLEPEDFDEPRVSALAAQTNLDTAAFRAAFARVAAPQPSL